MKILFLTFYFQLLYAEICAIHLSESSVERFMVTENEGHEKRTEPLFYFHDPLQPPMMLEPCEGLCIPSATCQNLGGVANSLCPGGAAVCCHFENTCKRVTKESQSYWTSPNYPGPTVGTLLCQYEVIIQPGICGVRLDFKEFNTTKPLDRGLCHIDQLLILNSLDGAAFSSPGSIISLVVKTKFHRCGELSGYSTIVPVDARQRMPLILLSLIQSSQETFKWNVKVTQMKCDETKRISDHAGCGKKFAEADAVFPTMPGESDNEVQESPETQIKEFSRETADTYFYIEYLKRAYESLTVANNGNSTNSTINPTINNTLCKNTPADIEAEKLKERIIRGQDALLHEFPWQISIQDQKGHICGGAIIDEYNILTAAHCFMSVSPVPLRKLKVILGDLNINSTTEANHLEASIHSVLFHSHFDPYYLKNDIALIRLMRPIKFRIGIQPVCLPETGNSYAGKHALISGWGAVNFPMGKLATHLQRVDNEVIENAECKRVLKVDYIYSTMLCATAPKCSGTCFGDSGGPLVYEDKNGSSRIIGIVSFGIGGCALLPYWPDVYTRVTEYLDWLSYATTWV